MNILHLLNYHKPMTGFTIARNFNRDVKLPVFYIFWTGAVRIKRYRNAFCTRSMGTAQYRALFLIGCSAQQWRACPLCRQSEFWEATPLLTHVTLLQRACLDKWRGVLASTFLNRKFSAARPREKRGCRWYCGFSCRFFSHSTDFDFVFVFFFKKFIPCYFFAISNRFYRCFIANPAHPEWRPATWRKPPARRRLPCSSRSRPTCAISSERNATILASGNGWRRARRFYECKTWNASAINGDTTWNGAVSWTKMAAGRWLRPLPLWRSPFLPFISPLWSAKNDRWLPFSPPPLIPFGGRSLTRVLRSPWRRSWLRREICPRLCLLILPRGPPSSGPTPY